MRVLDHRGAVRHRGLLLVAAVPGAPDVGGVVGADGGAHLAVGEHTAGEQTVEIADRQQRHVEDVLLDQCCHLGQMVLGRLVAAGGLALLVEHRTRHRDAAAHVAVLGVANDEILRPARILTDALQLLLEAVLGHDIPVLPGHRGPGGCVIFADAGACRPGEAQAESREIGSAVGARGTDCHRSKAKTRHAAGEIDWPARQTGGER